MRGALLLLLLLSACGKSPEQKRRELTLCIMQGTDERSGITDPYRVGFCLHNLYGWSFEDTQEAEVQVARAARANRLAVDSARRGWRRQ